MLNRTALWKYFEGNPARFGRLGVATLFFLVLGAVVNNQQWEGAYFSIGRCINLMAIASAGLFVGLGARRNEAFLIALVALVFVAGGLQALIKLDAGYLMFQNALFFLAGSLMGSCFLEKIRAALTVMAYISVPVMILQVLGAGEWVYFLSTHGMQITGESISKTPVATLFVPINELGGTFLQGRPAGPFHSNQYATILAVAGLAVYFDVSTSRRIRSLIFLGVFGVLTLSKVFFLAALFMFVFILCVQVRRRMKAVQLLMGLFAILGAYSILFPGVVGTYLGLAVIVNSALLRIVDVLRLLPIDLSNFGIYNQLIESGAAVLDYRALGAVEAQPREVQVSGIAQFIELWRVSMPIFLLLAFGYFNGVKRMQRPPFFTILLMIGLMTVLLSSGMLLSQTFWFLSGVALYPVGSAFWRTEATSRAN